MTELLAPVGDWDTLATAINAGADSVYFGIKWINMRASSARNFDVSELKEVMEKLHKNNVKGFLALNTLIYDHELSKVKEIITEAKKANVDAIIAADMSVVQICNDKDVEVHISTQESVSNYEAVKFFSKFSPRIVLARECTLDQIKEIKRRIKEDKLNYNGREIELETFIHGSLCVAYSGRCFMSQHHNRLSANRGQCLQECRKKYKIIDIEDPRREFILGEDYVMSPKDLCTLPIIDQLIEAGIDVFKIEGRAKGPEYIHTVTKAYRTAIDLVKENKFNQKEALILVKELEKVFNRGFTTNFFLGTPTNDSWTKFYGSSATEKKIKVGKVINYYAKKGIASIQIEQEPINQDDKIFFSGPTTGYLESEIGEMWINEKPANKSKRGDEVTFEVKKKVRTSDTVYKIVKRDVNEEEENIKKQYEKTGIHKPFKFLGKDKGMD
ncbi:U32 family peptidase [Candidatus Woesearchaeota archaeon]|jgi:U32 family peptidase|nr:U32 family peptidase [Candidatus Woesearchaeota archaeon]MBT5215834.1 U32 family peptidase [Candidatus Woesearchaeota archaeon]